MGVEDEIARSKADCLQPTVPLQWENNKVANKLFQLLQAADLRSFKITAPLQWDLLGLGYSATIAMESGETRASPQTDRAELQACFWSQPPPGTDQHIIQLDQDTHRHCCHTRHCHSWPRRINGVRSECLAGVPPPPLPLKSPIRQTGNPPPPPLAHTFHPSLRAPSRNGIHGHSQQVPYNWCMTTKIVYERMVEGQCTSFLSSYSTSPTH